MQAFLPKHVVNSVNDSLEHKVCGKIHENEDVQFYWELLSQDINCHDDAQKLLVEIIKLWVTIRGKSIAASWMEVFKKTEKVNIDKSTSLRKSLSGIS